MEKIWKNFYKSSFISSIVLFVLGLLLIFASEVTIAVISYIIGGCLVAAGLTAIIHFFLTKMRDSFTSLDIVYGVVTIIAGVFIIMHPYAIGKFIPFVVGIAIIMSSAMKLQYSFQLRNLKNDIWKTFFIWTITFYHK